MKFAVIGTGMVGRAIAGRLSELGHDVEMGTRDVEATLAKSESDGRGTPALKYWLASHSAIHLETFASASASAEIVVNALSGIHALDVMQELGARGLGGKVLLDISVPIVRGSGMPPELFVANTDSLGEQIQRAVPSALVVKSLNTVWCEIMVRPERLPAPHSMFVAGNSAEAKETVIKLLQQFGWPEKSLIDLGDISASRATEMYSKLLFTLASKFGSFDFNISLVRSLAP